MLALTGAIDQEQIAFSPCPGVFVTISADYYSIMIVEYRCVMIISWRTSVTHIP
jgi:hypothetical protein